MESLYEACGSDQKEIHIAEGPDHGTDMITVPEEGELGYAVLPKSQEERKARDELADELMRFVSEAFGEDKAAEETDGFLHREIYKEIPPKVEYSLTAFGESFIPVLQTMMEWSETWLCPEYQNPYQKNRYQKNCLSRY